MSEMSDEVAVHESSSRGVLDECRLLYHKVWTIVNVGHSRTLSTSLTVIGSSWLYFSRSSSVATEGGKNQFYCFVFPLILLK